MPTSRACRAPSDRLGGRRAAYRAAQTGASERPPCHAVNRPAESEVGMGDLWLGCSLVFLPITPSAPSLCWLRRRSRMLMQRLTETSFDCGYFLAEQRSAVKTRSFLSGAAPSCLRVRSLSLCAGRE